MSYSRWITSYWYTFWCSQDPITENRDTAIFDICDVCSFTSKELRDDIDGCLRKVGDLDPDGDLDELLIYINRFLADVNESYPLEGL